MLVDLETIKPFRVTSLNSPGRSDYQKGLDRYFRWRGRTMDQD